MVLAEVRKDLAMEMLSNGQHPLSTPPARPCAPPPRPVPAATNWRYTVDIGGPLDDSQWLHGASAAVALRTVDAAPEAPRVLPPRPRVLPPLPIVPSPPIGWDDDECLPALQAELAAAQEELAAMHDLRNKVMRAVLVLRKATQQKEI